ncbi:hypothetical protein DAI22_12g065900 [Oryza sativa Japonica Group]|nr:hypothetical protein DAI22_12g065900 [Oryza sativa Japonica Group]
MASSYSECSSTSSHPTNRAPIPPHVGPFEYHPVVMCKGGAKAARWISWGVDNPSRRYHKCHNQGAGCNLFDWYDPPSSSFMREPLYDLRDVVLSLRGRRLSLSILLMN